MPTSRRNSSAPARCRARAGCMTGILKPSSAARPKTPGSCAAHRTAPGRIPAWCREWRGRCPGRDVDRPRRERTPRASRRRAPLAHVHFLVEQEQGGVEAAALGEGLAAEHHESAEQVVDVGRRARRGGHIVLATQLEPREETFIEAVGAHRRARLRQLLRPDDADVRLALQIFDQRREAVAVKQRVGIDERDVTAGE